MESMQNDRSSVLARYLAEIRECPLLTREEEATLAQEVKLGDKEALNELIESNLSFVVKVANEYRSRGLPLEDLLNEGNIGLIEAAQRYDASKGTKFITYAIWWVRKSMLKALSENSNLVRVPNYQMKKVREIRETENTLRRSLGRKPERAEVSEQLSKSLSKIDQILQFSVREVSLDQQVGSERSAVLSDSLVDRHSASPEEDLIQRESSSLACEAMALLSDQEKAVIVHRFGLAGSPPLTLREIGDKMGISRERVRQIECRAKDRLQRILAGRRTVRAPSKRPFHAAR